MTDHRELPEALQHLAEDREPFDPTGIRIVAVFVICFWTAVLIGLHMAGLI